MSSYAPKRGDVVWLSLNPQAGHEQAGRRPVVVLSRTRYNRRTGMAIVCPITSRVKGFPFEVALPIGLPVHGVVLSDQAKSIDWQARGAEYLCVVTDRVLKQIVQRVRALIEVA